MAERTGSGTRNPDVVRVEPIPRKRRRPTKSISHDNRAHNRALLLRTLYHDGPMSRSDLARASMLTRPTVSTLVAELLGEQIVSEVGVRAEPRVGKPATLVRIADDALNVVAIDLSHTDRIIGAVLNLRGRILSRAERPLDGAVGAAARALVAGFGANLLQSAPHPVVGVGIGTPGIIDDEGTVRYAEHLRWTDLPLAAELSHQYGVPVSVANDLNMAALGIQHFRDVDRRDLIAISIDVAIGMGLVVGGRLVEGKSFAAGEIGHITVEEPGDLCRCGRHGCLEVCLERAHDAVHSAGIIAAERAGALAAAGRAVGVLVAPITTALDISKVVVLGPADLLTPELVEAAQSTVSSRTLPVINAGVDILPMTDDDLILLGATANVLARRLGVL